jgi:hypothetical protein
MEPRRRVCLHPVVYIYVYQISSGSSWLAAASPS